MPARSAIAIHDDALLAALPSSALDDRIAIVGTAGSGKTYAAKGFVERLLDSGARVAIVDPLGVWWGLRASADVRIDRDRGTPRGAAPPTPPGIRVRTTAVRSG
jgi:DNA helicase HerA-like ATPase